MAANGLIVDMPFTIAKVCKNLKKFCMLLLGKEAFLVFFGIGAIS
jgi:hypothetical protein